MTNKAFISQMRYNGILELSIHGNNFFGGLKAKLEGGK
jgi:hypothetical protein